MSKRVQFFTVLIVALIAGNVLSKTLPLARAQESRPAYSHMWKVAELPLQVGWGAYTAGDTWPGVNGNGDYVIKIEPALPPGRYRVQVRTMNVPKLEVSIAGQRHELKLIRNAFSEPLEIQTQQPADSLTMSGAGILQAVYLTSNLQERVGANDIAVRTATEAVNETQIPPAPVRTGNYLENSSFEVGSGHGWGKFWNDQLDASTAVDGKTSLRIPTTMRFVGSDVGWVYEIQKLETKFYRLPPGQYTISGYFKADKATKARGFFGLYGHPDDPKELGLTGQAALYHAKSSPGPRLGINPEIGTEWKRLSFTVEVPAVPGNLWSLQFNAEWRVIERGFKFDSPFEEILKADFKDIPKNIWVDALQIERAATPSEYSARGGVEAGVRCDQPGFILYDNEPSTVQLLVYNPQKSNDTLTVDYRIQDYHNATVKQEQLKIPLKGQPNLTLPIQLPHDKRGIFRLVLSHEKDRESKDELVYCVLPPNPHLNSFHPAGHAGSDTTLNPRTLAILKRANINWLIHKHLGRMEVAQPRLGEYHWFDEELQHALDAKMMVLGQVFVNDPPAYMEEYVPGAGGMRTKGTVAEWDPAKKQKYLEIWGDYVTKLVSHYKGKINHWEVTNEPYFWATPEQHADILRVASEAIRKVDPKIEIIGFCSANMREYFPRAVRAADPSWYDGASGHFYDGNGQVVQLRFLASVLKKQNKTGWQTEAGPTFPSFYETLPTYQQLMGMEHHANASSLTLRDAFTIRSLTGDLRCFGQGRISHYFHYISRFANASPSEPTRRIGSGKEDVEYSGALRPYAVARSITAHFLDGTTHYDEWRGDPRLTVALFAKDKGTVGYAWSNDGRRLDIAPQNLKGWQIYDFFGNKLPAQKGGIAVDRFPRYFTVAAAPAQVARLLDAGRVSGLLNVDARLRPTADGTGTALNLLVHNETSAPQTVALSFGGVLGGYVGNSASVAALQLKPGEQRQITLPLLRLPANRTVTINARAGDAVIDFPFQFALAQAPRVADAAALANAPLQAFNFDLVREGNGNRMSAADFTPSFQTGYDAANLYLSATVQDDLLSPAPGKIIAGENDQVHFQIAAQTPQRAAEPDPRQAFARKASASDFMVAIAPASETAAIAELHKAGGTSETLPATMQKTADGYRVTVAVPWAKIGMAAPNYSDSLAFNVVAFDADGVNLDHKTEWPWAGGPNFEYGDPAGWGELNF